LPIYQRLTVIGEEHIVGDRGTLFCSWRRDTCSSPTRPTISTRRVICT